MLEGFEEDGGKIHSVDDATQQNSPVYYNEQIDQMILTPETRSNVITRKKPNFVKVPVFWLDEKGEKVPVRDDNGRIKTNEKGEVLYVIKDYKVVQKGWKSVLEVIPASEIFSIDNSTSNISQDAVKLLTRMYWFHNYLQIYQDQTEADYSLYLHKLRNDAHSILQASKSYNGGTVQAIKTFINRTDSRQWNQEGSSEPKKENVIAKLFGGSKPKKSNPEPMGKSNFNDPTAFTSFK